MLGGTERRSRHIHEPESLLGNTKPRDELAGLLEHDTPQRGRRNRIVNISYGGSIIRITTQKQKQKRLW